jgi:mono/diheme cytochrome c family protein
MGLNITKLPNISTILFAALFFIAAACGSSTGKEANSAVAAQQQSDSKLTPDGMAVFRQKCVTCHGADGKLGLNGAKDLSQSTLTLEERINIVTNGKKLMTPFGTILSPEEIQSVAEYTKSFKK